MTIPIEADSQWQIAEKALLLAAVEVSNPYIDHAKNTMKAQALQQNLEEPKTEPRVQNKNYRTRRLPSYTACSGTITETSTVGTGYHPTVFGDITK